MKKRLFLLGVAVAALASCTNEEVTDVASNRAIRFDPFVNNNTKAVTEVTTAELSSYYVFGKFGDAQGTYTQQIFNNELQTTTYYWTASKYYSFGAYADGNNGKLAKDVAFDADNGKLTFTNYTVGEKDLVAAVAKMQCNADAAQQGKVGLNFKHLLSQVKFTFKTTDGDAYTIAISDLKFNAVNKADGTYTQNTITWDGTTAKADYTYGNIADVADVAKQYTAETDSKLVIPQAGTDQIKATFKAKITGPGMGDNGKEATFEATLAVAQNIAGTSAANTWVPGYRYNYTAEINAEKIFGPEDKVYKIEFTPQVEEWHNTNPVDSGTTPNKPAQP